VRARNLVRESPNRIHDDEAARRHGYAAGLVAGSTLYAYLSRPLVAAWGEAWLARGTARLRLRRPVYDGDLLEVDARVVARSGSPVAGEVVVRVEASGPREGAVAAAVAGLAWGAPPPAPDPAGYPAASPRAVRPPASPEALAGLGPLAGPVEDLEGAALAAYADAVEDPAPLYRGPGAALHPGLVLQQANLALAASVALGPWVHVESDVAHLGAARAGERIATRGRVARVFERWGRRLVELDLLVAAGEGRPVAHVRHTAIYDLAPAGPTGEGGAPHA
jgi:acyl dehydratase